MTPTEQHLVEVYHAPTLKTEHLAQVTGMKNARSVLEAIRRGTFPIRTYRAGKLRLADVRDVAAYIDRQRNSSK